MLGLVLVFGSGFGFWFVLRIMDQRAEYLAAARDIERWEVAVDSDFIVVEANVGTATALAAERRDAVLGKWATGRIPAGTIIAEGLFAAPPLSGESESDKVLMQVRLPSSAAPFGTLDTGDTVALLGRESSGAGGEPGPFGLIGVLTLEFVKEDDIFYVVTPEDALTIKGAVDRFTAANDRTILKLGFDLSTENLVNALEAQAAIERAARADARASPLTDSGSGPEPAEEQ